MRSDEQENEEWSPCFEALLASAKSTVLIGQSQLRFQVCCTEHETIALPTLVLLDTSR